jgi:hypothetical protein
VRPPVKQSWEVQFVNNTAPTLTSTKVHYAYFWDNGEWVDIDIAFTGTLGGAAGPYLYFTLPRTGVDRSGVAFPLVGGYQLSGAKGCTAVIGSNTSLCLLHLDDASNWPNAGDIQFYVTGRYRKAQ